MEKVNFDEYAENYDNLLREQLGFFSEDDKYFARYKIQLVRDHIRIQPRRVLEYGCGTGRNLPFLKEAFPAAEIFGVDISAQSIVVAAENNRFAKCSLLEAGFVGNVGSFDLIFVAGVFHHIAPPERGASLKQLDSLLSEGGSLFVFEHNPYNPITRKMVRECPFDTDAVLVSMKRMEELLMKSISHSNVLKKYTLFVPPALHNLRRIEKYLGWLPLGGQYFIRLEKQSVGNRL